MLLNQLSAPWRFFPSVEWRALGRDGEVIGEADVVVFHPQHGLVVFEIKGGAIHIEEGKWFYLVEVFYLSKSFKRPEPLQKDYSDNSLWDKIKNYAKSAGKEVIEKVLYLYFALQNPNTPIWAKTTIIGALGYFISPIDAIPDLLPMVGYTDDLGVIAAALVAVASYIDYEVKAKANAKLTQWFD